MKTFERLMKALGKSMNTMKNMEKPSKTTENSMNSSNGEFLASKFDKVRVVAPKCSTSKERCHRLKQKQCASILYLGRPTVC